MTSRHRCSRNSLDAAQGDCHVSLARVHALPAVPCGRSYRRTRDMQPCGEFSSQASRNDDILWSTFALAARTGSRPVSTSIRVLIAPTLWAMLSLISRTSSGRSLPHTKGIAAKSRRDCTLVTPWMRFRGTGQRMESLRQEIGQLQRGLVRFCTRDNNPFVVRRTSYCDLFDATAG
jgi:hypothetical protein